MSACVQTKYKSKVITVKVFSHCLEIRLYRFEVKFLLYLFYLGWTLSFLHMCFGMSSAWEGKLFSEFRTEEVKGKLFSVVVWLLQIVKK